MIWRGILLDMVFNFKLLQHLNELTKIRFYFYINKLYNKLNLIS